MADPRFFDNTGPYRLDELARIGATSPAPAGSEAVMVSDVASIDASHPAAIVFVATKSALLRLKTFRAAAVIAPPSIAGSLPTDAPVLEAKDASTAFSRIAHHFYPRAIQNLGASGNIAIDPTARISIGVTLEPGVVVGAHAEIGPGSHVAANVVIGRGVAIGRDCFIGANSSVLAALIGDNVIVHPGVRIGQDGFGFTSSAAGHAKVPHLGRVIIQDQVELGANCAIDRGRLGDTVIGEGCKFDNMVHIAHNATVGRNCMMLAQAAISGSTTLGDFVILGGQAGLGDHVNVGAGARIAGGSMATANLEGGQDYCGIPAMPIRGFLRTVKYMRKISKGETPGHE